MWDIYDILNGVLLFAIFVWTVVFFVALEM